MEVLYLAVSLSVASAQGGCVRYFPLRHCLDIDGSRGLAIPGKSSCPVYGSKASRCNSTEINDLTLPTYMALPMSLVELLINV